MQQGDRYPPYQAKSTRIFIKWERSLTLFQRKRSTIYVHQEANCSRMFCSVAWAPTGWGKFDDIETTDVKTLNVEKLHAHTFRLLYSMRMASSTDTRQCERRLWTKERIKMELHSPQQSRARLRWTDRPWQTAYETDTHPIIENASTARLKDMCEYK